jgi:hypothetical protein
MILLTSLRTRYETAIKMSNTNRGDGDDGHADQYDWEWSPGHHSKKKTSREERRNSRQENRDLLDRYREGDYDDEEN